MENVPLEANCGPFWEALDGPQLTCFIISGGPKLACLISFKF